MNGTRTIDIKAKLSMQYYVMSHDIRLFIFITVFYGTENTPRKIIGIHIEYKEYSIEYYRSHKTLLWIWIMKTIYETKSIIIIIIIITCIMHFHGSMWSQSKCYDNGNTHFVLENSLRMGVHHHWWEKNIRWGPLFKSSLWEYSTHFIWYEVNVVVKRNVLFSLM